MQAAATGPLVSLSPSFNTYSSSDRLAQIAARVVDEFTHQDRQLTQEPDWESIYDHQEEEKLHHRRQPKNDDVQKEKEEEEEEEFEFAFVSSGGESHTSPISADDIFSNGQIKPTVYPLFNQDLLLAHNDVVSSTNANGDADDAVKNPKPHRLPLRMLMIEEERETASCSSSEADDLENLPPGTYCVWAPPKSSSGQRRCNKSSSAGSSSKRWKFRNLLHRSSSSDGIVFLAPSSTKRANNKGDDVTRKRVDNGDGGGGGVSENGERYVVRSKAEEAGDKRRSFLPYRQDFVGFFSNVNGISRNLHPF